MTDEDDPVVPDAIDRAGAEVLNCLVDGVGIRRNRNLGAEGTSAGADADPVKVEGREARGVRGTDVRVRLRLIWEVPIVFAVGRARDEYLNCFCPHRGLPRRVADIAGQVRL